MRCQRQILDVYAGGLMSPMQRCFSDLVCQPLVTSYVIDAYLCLAMHVARLDHRVPAHDALRPTVDTYESRKAMASWLARESAKEGYKNDTRYGEF